MADTTGSAPRRRGLFFVIAGVAALAIIVGVALLINIFERKQEARNPFYRVVELTEDTEDPAVWGKNFPLQYDDYRRTVDQVRTRFGGSEALPRTPTQADPRTVVAQSKIEEDPRLKAMWAGYAFAKDFREERGHAYMLDDQIFTERQQAAKQPGTCLQCHASLYVPYRKAGNGDLIKGFEKLNPMPYAEARKLVCSSGGLHRLPRLEHHAAPGHPPRLHRGHPRVQGLAGRAELRRQRARDAPGDARLRVRPVPRRVLLQGTGEAAGLSVGQGAEGRGDPGVLRRGAVQGLDSRRHRRPRAQGSASGVRDVESGHSRPLRRDVRRLPHAVQAGRRAQDQRPPRPQPDAQRQPGVPDLPRVAGGRAEGAGRDDPAAHVTSCATWRWMR